jgi:folate-binding protein YgfZ
MSVQWMRLDRDFLLVQGVDAEKYLHSQLSQSVQGMAVGSAQHSLLLQPTGKLDAVLRISRLEDTIFVLDMEPGTAQGAVLRLKKFMIRVQATIEVVQWQCVALRGEGALEVAKSLGRIPSEGAVVAAWWPTSHAVDLVGPAVADIPADSATVMSNAEFHSLRVNAGWPVVGIDIETGCVPGETGLLGVAVSFSKGCYPGQELVERMDSRAAVSPHVLRRVEVAAGAQVGDHIVVDGADCGVVTSVAGSVAIARMSRSANEYGEALQPA